MEGWDPNTALRSGFPKASRIQARTTPARDVLAAECHSPPAVSQAACRRCSCLQAPDTCACLSMTELLLSHWKLWISLASRDRGWNPGRAARGASARFPAMNSSGCKAKSTDWAEK